MFSFCGSCSICSCYVEYGFHVLGVVVFQLCKECNMMDYIYVHVDQTEAMRKRISMKLNGFVSCLQCKRIMAVVYTLIHIVLYKTEVYMKNIYESHDIGC